jgi:hypothetical protein
MHLRKWLWTALLALPLTVAGVVYGKALAERRSEQPPPGQEQSFTCPLTGEQLPCPLCCPLNQEK